MFNRENIEKVSRAYEEKRKRAEDAAEERTMEAQARIPALRAVDREMSAIGMKVFAASLEGGADFPARIEKLKEENLALQKKHGDLLEAAGLPRDYTKVHRECEKCGDSGFVGTNICTCMKRAVILEGYRTSGLGKLLEKQTFDSFDLHYYSDAPLPDKNFSAREAMAGILQTCREYAAAFSLDSHSLLLIGGTGLGKTHLSSAMAREIIDQGFDVVYDSVPNIISAFEKDRFDTEGENARTQKYFDAELLIMDDLGTESTGKTAQSVIYNLINSRTSVYARPTIISTNLSYRQLEKQYDSPVISRLFGEFDVLLFTGEDVRRARLGG